jgi:hypothetical protein
LDAALAILPRTSIMAKPKAPLLSYLYSRVTGPYDKLQAMALTQVTKVAAFAVVVGLLGTAKANPLGNPAPAVGDGVIARLGTLKWRGLAGPIQFTPDGKALVVLMGGGALEWRDIETGKQLQASDVHTGTVWSVLPLPDGKHLLSRDHNRLLVWHCPIGNPVR